MARVGGDKFSFTWSGTAGESDASITSGRVVAGSIRRRRPVFDDSPLATEPLEFLPGSETVTFLVDLDVDLSSPGLPPPSGVIGTATMDTDGNSTNQFTGSAYLYGVDHSFRSDNESLQRGRYYCQMTGTITDTNP